MTNYIHMLGAGHVTYYLLKKRNLYRYSNQAWERLNKRMKRCYLTKTQRGGHGVAPYMTSYIRHTYTIHNTMQQREIIYYILELYR